MTAADSAPDGDTDSSPDGAADSTPEGIEDDTADSGQPRSGDGAEPPGETRPGEARGPHPRNLLGRVPILVYHRIGLTEDRWTRTPAGFWEDLVGLYEAGFRPIRLRDYLTGQLDLPPGYAPVILTFDDATAGQFAWAEDGPAEDRPDPDSAVGVLLRFAEQHANFSPTAVFFINADPFGEDGKSKVEWLVEHDFEVENHTWFHADLSRVDQPSTVREVGKMASWIKATTGTAPVAIALPFGARPRHTEAALSGDYEGGAYEHRALLLVGSGPARSPLDPDFDPLRLNRIQVADPAVVSDRDRPSIWDTWRERLLERGDLYAN